MVLENKYQYFGEENEKRERKKKYWYDKSFNPKQLIEIFLDAAKKVGYEIIKNNILKIIFENIFDNNFTISKKQLKDGLNKYNQFLQPESHNKYKHMEIFKSPTIEDVKQFVLKEQDY